MILDTITKLEIVLAGAITTNQLEVHVSYRDWNKSGTTTNPAMFRTASNSTTDVTILAAPVQNPVREVLTVSVYNKDTVSSTVTIKSDDGTTERIFVKQELLTTETLTWTPDAGWFII